MIGEEPSPGRFERFVLAIPEGVLLRAVFLGLLGLSLWVLSEDLRELHRRESDEARMTRTEPMPLARPEPGDQIRPYLPRTIPVGPDRGQPVLPGHHGPVDGAAMAEPMRFVRGEAGAVAAIGRIDPGTADIFRAFLDETGEAVATLVLHSPGGSVADAIRMARLVRERGIDTAVPADGYCASACPLLFSGGVRRTAGAQSWIGLHQVYAVDIPGLAGRRALDRSIADIQATIAECQQLLLDMGVKPEVWIQAMKTPANELYVLTPEELGAFALVSPPDPPAEPAA